jgi:four helix bundle protein
MMQVASCGIGNCMFFVNCTYVSLLTFINMKSYRDLEIYKLAFELAKKVHYASLKLPQFELFEQGSQIRRSSKSVKDQIAEGFGRRRYKAEFIKFLIYSHSSSDETSSQLEMLKELYPKIQDFFEISPEYENLGRKINCFIDYVENNWRT